MCSDCCHTSRSTPGILLPSRRTISNGCASCLAIAGAVAFIQGAGLAAVSDRQSGVLIAGIDPEQYQTVSGLAAFTATDGTGASGGG